MRPKKLALSVFNVQEATRKRQVAQEKLHYYVRTYGLWGPKQAPQFKGSNYRDGASAPGRKQSA